MSRRKCKAIHDGIKCGIRFEPAQPFTQWCSDDCKLALAMEKLAKIRLQQDRARNKAIKDQKKAYNQKTKQMREKIQPKKRKTGGVLREPLDIVFSYLVRERCNWICEVCNTDYSDNRGEFDCSHFKSRNNKSVRYHPLNAMGHCRSCHSKLGNDHNAMVREYDKSHGSDSRERIVFLSNQPCKLSAAQVKELLDHYKSEEKRFKAVRSGGYDGYLEFTCLDWYMDQCAAK